MQPAVFLIDTGKKKKIPANSNRSLISLPETTASAAVLYQTGLWKLAEEKPLASTGALEPNERRSSSVSPEVEVFAQGISCCYRGRKKKRKK